MQSLPHEIVYVNGGEIYKSPTPYDLNTQYLANPDGDPIFPLMKADGKQYIFTTEFKSYFSGGEGADLTGIDLCPDVTLWIAFGAVTPTDRTNFDIAFAVDSSQQLQTIADYYNLPYPVTQEIAGVIDTAPQTIEFWNVNGRSIVFGAIKYIDGVASILKLYTYPKLFGDWNASRYGLSYYNNGQVWEAGAMYEKLTGGVMMTDVRLQGRGNFMKAQRVLVNRADGKRFKFTTEFTGVIDPLIQWRGYELDENDNIVNTRYYESSIQLRTHVGGMSAGDDLRSYDLCPSVNIWAGKSTWETGTEEELFFVVDSGSGQLQAVADYYNLPYPIDAEVTTQLDTNSRVYRATNLVPYVFGSIVFDNGTPVRLLLNTFQRQSEFQEQIVLPF